MVLFMMSEVTIVSGLFEIIDPGLAMASTSTDSAAAKRSPKTDLVVRLCSTIDSN